MEVKTIMEKRAKRAGKTTTTASKRANNANMEASNRVGKTTRTKATEMEASSKLGKTTRANTAHKTTRSHSAKACK